MNDSRKQKKKNGSTFPSSSGKKVSRAGKLDSFPIIVIKYCVWVCFKRFPSHSIQTKEHRNSSSSERRIPAAPQSEFERSPGTRRTSSPCGRAFKLSPAPKTFPPREDICAHKGWSEEAITEGRKLTWWSLSC